MSAPFEKFEVTLKWSNYYYLVHIPRTPDLPHWQRNQQYEIDEWREDVRRFIRDAIHEKLEREKGRGSS
jgi:hypothetical protein